MKVETDKMRLIGPGVIETIRSVHWEELFRDAASKEISDHYVWHLEQRDGGWHDGQIREFVRGLEEWKDKHNAPPPIPDPLPILRSGRVGMWGNRGVQDDDGPFHAVGLSRFTWLRDWKFNRDRVLREIESDVVAGYLYARVLAQVDNMGSDTFWSGREVDYRWHDHEELVAGLTTAAYARGLRILWTFMGKPIKRTDRAGFVARMKNVLRDAREGVLVQEIMNEPNAGGDVYLQELLDLHAIASENGILTATGAVWTEKGWVPEYPDFEGATAFSPFGWEHTQKGVGICHLDRDTSKGEYQDRPWRQAWDVGLEGMRWIDNEHIGPGSSVNTEDRPQVLRSHRAVAFISRAFASCFHSSSGVRGLTPVEEEPGYSSCPAATRFLPPDIVNGQQQNANNNYPDRHWHVDEQYIRAISGKGCVRAYGVQANGCQYTLVFGLVSEVKLRAQKDMYVECFQQDINERLSGREIREGEEYVLSPTYADYLLISGDNYASM